MIAVHRYLRAIGFSKVKKREELQALIGEVVERTILKPKNPEQDKIERINEYMFGRDITVDEEECVYAELFLDFTHGAGICVRGEFDEDNSFLYEYHFPYVRGTHISSNEDVTIERHAEKESYAGVCDDIKVGVSLIFYLQNMIPYIKAKNSNILPVRGTTLTLSALSIEGRIMMPINKSENDLKRNRQVSINRSQLLNAARRGDENAIESLTLDDMDTYTAISKRIQNEDVFSLVDTYFMPYGVECDQYSVLGEIMELNTVRNKITDEEIYMMTINCNDLTFDLCINKIDLFGEPCVGRRFKGVLWMPGDINVPG